MSVSGWILLDKDSGIFSRTAGGRIARMFGTKKFGHIGTLDPMASGVLPIAIGDATKMIPFIEDLPNADIKEYLFSVQFGFETDTLDITGTETRRTDVIPTMDAVLGALPGLVGKIMQTPPIYSAVHVDGKRAYDVARRGGTVEIPPRPITVYALEFMGCNGASWMFRTQCSRGTYVRAIGRDIAAQCGTVGTVDMIRRVKTGGFDIKNTVKLDFLEKAVNNNADIGEYLMPVDFGLADIPVQNLNHDAAVLYANGGFVNVDVADGLYRVYDGDKFVGIGRVMDGTLRPKRTI